MGFRSWWVNAPVIGMVVVVALLMLPIWTGLGLSVLLIGVSLWALSGPQILVQIGAGVARSGMAPSSYKVGIWVFFIVCLILIAYILFTNKAHAQSKWPADVQRFIQRRDACDHFRGEDPYDEERRKFLQQKMAEFCIGTDQELSRLKTRYRNDKKITAKLNEYEQQVEPSREK